MRSVFILLACFGLLALTGCGDNSGATGPMTDEQKKAVQLEDQKIADEESQGSINKKKAKK